jgi:ABC-2 type transport system permease protein
MNVIPEFVFHIRQLLRNSYFVQTAFVAPIVFVLLRVQAAHTTATLWLDGTVVGFWTTTVTAVGILGYQRAQGTLEQIALTPRPLGTALAPITVACTTVGTISAPAAMLTTSMFSTLHPPPRPAFVGMGLVLVFLACGASSLLLGGLFVITRHALVYEPVLVTPILLVSGAVIDRDALPTPIRGISVLHPITGAVELLHIGSGAVEFSASAAAVWTGQTLATATLLAVLAGLVLRVATRRALREGTLSLS